MKVWQYESNDNDELSKKLDKDPSITYTCEEMAIHLISLIDFKDGDIVMEPCYGSGNIYNNLPTNKDIEKMFYSSEEDLGDKINYYLSNEEEREEIALKVKNYINSNHTWENRANLILEKIKINKNVGV